MWRSSGVAMLAQLLVAVFVAADPAVPLPPSAARQPPKARTRSDPATREMQPHSRRAVPLGRDKGQRTSRDFSHGRDLDRNVHSRPSSRRQSNSFEHGSRGERQEHKDEKTKKKKKKRLPRLEGLTPSYNCEYDFREFDDLKPSRDIPDDFRHIKPRAKKAFFEPEEKTKRVGTCEDDSEL